MYFVLYRVGNKSWVCGLPQGSVSAFIAANKPTGFRPVFVYGCQVLSLQV